jgi:hypothetical protein
MKTTYTIRNTQDIEKSHERHYQVDIVKRITVPIGTEDESTKQRVAENQSSTLPKLNVIRWRATLPQPYPSYYVSVVFKHA